jgi:hypothetical protein
MSSMQDLTSVFTRRALAQCAVGLTAVIAVACGGSPADEPAAGAPAVAADAAPASTTPRVFFMTPQDGATVTPTTHLMFGSEAFEIAAVPPGELTESRASLGHYHVAVDADCLPAGTEIPKADPWVHFGDGGSMMNMQLPLGEHRLTLQVGDDLHRAMEGLCQTITVTVKE